jgi:hypothetical protein
MNEPRNDPWFELGVLLTAIDSHQLVTGEPSEADEKLYWAAKMARSRISDV